MSDLVGNPEDRFSHNEAHISLMIVRFWETAIFFESRYERICFSHMQRVVKDTDQLPLFFAAHIHDMVQSPRSLHPKFTCISSLSLNW